MRPVPSGFMTAVRVYSEAFCERPDLKNGNKIILPQSALSELARLKVSYPMIFRAVNIPMSRKCYCGVLEFIAEEGVCYMPHWMMNNLFLEEGAEVHIQNVTLPKGTFVAIQPHETAFIDLANPKAILENELTNYACLTKGETINICYGGKDFLIDIVETLPHEAICVVEADIEVDFRQPKANARVKSSDELDLLQHAVVESYILMFPLKFLFTLHLCSIAHRHSIFMSMHNSS